MTAFWNVALCSLVEVYRCFKGAYCLYHQDTMPCFPILKPVPRSQLAQCPDDGGSKRFWNVDKLLPDYTVQEPRRQSSSYSLPWEPEISPATISLNSINRLIFVNGDALCFVYGKEWMFKYYLDELRHQRVKLTNISSGSEFMSQRSVALRRHVHNTWRFRTLAIS
jgi:hypothetical protein